MAGKNEEVQNLAGEDGEEGSEKGEEVGFSVPSEELEEGGLMEGGEKGAEETRSEEQHGEGNKEDEISGGAGKGSEEIENDIFGQKEKRRKGWRELKNMKGQEGETQELVSIQFFGHWNSNRRMK